MNLYVSDLDGTLLGADSRVSATTVAVINTLVAERGINFTIATSRTPATVVPLMAGIDSRLPFITMSGAALWNPVTSRMEQVNVIPPDVVETVIGIMERYETESAAGEGAQWFRERLLATGDTRIIISEAAFAAYMLAFSVRTGKGI